MKILITGGGGFLGSGMCIPLAEAGHELRLMGRRAFESPHDVFPGDVTKLEDVEKALEGMDALIINHMAPRDPNAYETPDMCYDINVKGTANLFFAAEKLGVKKVVLISTTFGTKPPADPLAWQRTSPIPSNSLYPMTKACQETIGLHYAETLGFSVSVLRVGYIVDAEEMQDKYGRPIGERAPLDCDRRDVGEVARLCLERAKPGFDIFSVMSTHESLTEWGVQKAVDELGWQPRYDFDRLPGPGDKEKS